MKNGNIGRKIPTGQDIQQVEQLLMKYFDSYIMNTMFEDLERSSPDAKLDFVSKNHALFRQVNYGGYEFQYDEFVKEVFGKMSGELLQKLGFTADDAIIFAQKILSRYQRLFNEHKREVAEILRDNMSKLEDPVKGNELRTFFEQQQIDPKEALALYGQYLVYYGIGKLFLISPEEFCVQEEVTDCEKFRRYLPALSSNFGRENANFERPLDHNAIFDRPIIDAGNNQYFIPIPALLFDLHAIIPSLLDAEIRNATKIGIRYSKLKSRYVEDKIEEFLLRLFPPDAVFKNIYYEYAGKKPEIDVLVLYDNKVLIFEAKAKNLGEPSLRGDTRRLKNELKELIDDSRQQGMQAIEYIRSVKNASFTDENGNIKLRLEIPPNEIEFFVICPTLVPLGFWSTNVREFTSFTTGIYPWSVSIFDLDIVTKHIMTPSFFIHYLEKRLIAQQEEFFHSPSELGFLGWYLKYGNFYPVQLEGKQPNKVALLGFIDTFDDHYLFGRDPPRLEVDPRLLAIIQTLEKLHPKGITKISDLLLDLYPEHKTKIMNEIDAKIVLNSKDRKPHNSLNYYGEPFNFGISFIVMNGSREELRQQLLILCTMSKYKSKAKKWVGIAKDASDSEWPANLFLYTESEWIQDDEMDKVIETYFKDL